MAAAAPLIAELAPAHEAEAQAERWFAREERRLVALRSIVHGAQMVGSGDCGLDFRVPFFLLSAMVPVATHSCGPDCPCWETEA